MKKIIVLFFVGSVFFSCESDNETSHEEVFADKFESEDCLQKGEVLFSTNCKICHSLNAQSPTSMGPVLINIQKNWSDKKKLRAFISNASDQMQETERSRKIYSEWKDKAQMPEFAGLSNGEIECIIKFLYKNK